MEKDRLFSVFSLYRGANFRYNKELLIDYYVKVWTFYGYHSI